MRHILTILAALFVCSAPAQAQTLKSLMYNTTNGQVVANTGTNVLKFNDVVFNRLIAGATNQPANSFGYIVAQNGSGEEFHISAGGFVFYQDGTNQGGYFLAEERYLGGGTWTWASPFTFENSSIAATTRTNLGLGKTNVVEFGGLVAGANALSFLSNQIDVGVPILFSDRTNAVFAFEEPSVAATARTNLGATTIGNAVFTATNATAARQALGLQSYSLTLTNSVNDVEIGSTVSNVTIGWTIAPTDATYAVRTLVGASQTNSITNNSSTLARTGLALTSNTTWTLTVGDGLGVTNAATTSVNFLNYMIWGRSANTTLSNSNIQTLHTNGGGSSRAFATSRSRSFTMDGGGQFIFIAYPAGFGSASFTVGGLPNTAFTLTTNSYTNASGYVTNYLLYRTDTIQNGTGINFVVQ
jgi:hypothetical protein